MIEASKTAELSSQPTKRGRKAWLIALAVVVAVVTIALLANAPKPEPVKVWFVRATNEGRIKRLVFEGTNGMKGIIDLYAQVFSGAAPRPETQDGSRAMYDCIIVVAEAGTNFEFALKPASNGVPYFVVWASVERELRPTRWDGVRTRCYDFFNAHGMPRLACHFEYTPKLHYIPSTEIKE